MPCGLLWNTSVPNLLKVEGTLVLTPPKVWTSTDATRAPPQEKQIPRLFTFDKGCTRASAILQGIYNLVKKTQVQNSILPCHAGNQKDGDVGESDTCKIPAYHFKD